MSVSVLITTLNRKDFLEFTLGRLRRQLRGADQVVIVDDASDPADAEFLRSYALPCEKTLIRHDVNQGRFISKNAGIMAARHELVVQLDNDAWLVEDKAFTLFEAIFAHFPRLGALALPMHYHCRTQPQECGSLARRWSFPDLGIESCYMGCGVVLRRSAAVAAGLYPLYLNYGPEEEALSARMLKLGYQVRGTRQVRVIHGHEVLSGTPSYRASRDMGPEVDVAGNQLCIANESLARPLSWIYSLWVLGKARNKRLPLAEVVADYRSKHVQMSPWRYRMSLGKTFYWLGLRAYVYGRNYIRRKWLKLYPRIK